MVLISALYHHSTIGFPGVILKIHTEGDAIASYYITINGIIRKEAFKLTDSNGFEVTSIYGHSFTQSLDKFDKWVGNTFPEDSSVQG